MAADPKKTSETIRTQHLYNIRIAHEPGTPCAICEEATGSGPVGNRDDEAVCDTCILNESTDLGLVLALVSVTRALGAIPLKTDEAHEGLAQLAAFARVYEHVAAKKAERRGLDLPNEDAAQVL